MDTKEQALEKAQARQAELLHRGVCPVWIDIENCKFYVRQADLGKEDESVFPYAPPRETPPKGAIVKQFPCGTLFYSRGELVDGGLSVSVNDTMEEEDILPEWREVVDGERVKPFDVDCYSCSFDGEPHDVEPCASCTTTKPSHYKGADDAT